MVRTCIACALSVADVCVVLPIRHGGERGGRGPSSLTDKKKTPRGLVVCPLGTN